MTDGIFTQRKRETTKRENELSTTEQRTRQETIAKRYCFGRTGV